MVSDDPESFADLDGHYSFGGQLNLPGVGAVDTEGCKLGEALCQSPATQQTPQIQQQAQILDSVITTLNDGLPGGSAASGAEKEIWNIIAGLWDDARRGFDFTTAPLPMLSGSNTDEKAFMATTAFVSLGVPFGGKAKAPEAAYSVYRILEGEETVYVGITNNLARRSAEHGADLEKIAGGLTRGQARGVEQALIEHHGLAKNGGTLTNKINSIAKTKGSFYEEAVAFGRQLLRSISYY